MKSIIDFILESQEIKSVWAKTRNSILLQDKIKNFFKCQKDKVSLANKQELGKLFKSFASTLTFGSDIENRRILKEFGLSTEQGFKNFIYANQHEFEEKKWNTDWIKDFDLTEQEKAYKKAKENGEIPDGETFDDNDNIDDRELIIYDRYDPNIALVYSFKGKRGKDTNHYVNMCRVDFHYETDTKYYDCYSCLAKYYFSHSIEELKKDPQFDIDPNEIN